MKNKIRYSLDAQRDLDEIWDYIVADLCNPKAVERMANRIMDVVDSLVDFPAPVRRSVLLQTQMRIIVSSSPEVI